MSATITPRDLKLVSNDCYDNKVLSFNNIYDQADYPDAKKLENLRYKRKNTDKYRGVYQ